MLSGTYCRTKGSCWTLQNVQIEFGGENTIYIKSRFTAPAASPFIIRLSSGDLSVHQKSFPYFNQGGIRLFSHGRWTRNMKHSLQFLRNVYLVDVDQQISQILEPGVKDNRPEVYSAEPIIILFSCITFNFHNIIGHRYVVVVPTCGGLA